MAAAKNNTKPEETKPATLEEEETNLLEDEDTADQTPFVKSGFKKVKIKDFRGSYKDAFFDADGVCGEITQKTLDALSEQFPNAEIENIK